MTRTKLKIVSKKIRKYGQMGKIPMGASMRVYHENDDSDSSISSSGTSEQEEDTKSDNSSDAGGKSPTKSPRKHPSKKDQELLKTNQLVY